MVEKNTHPLPKKLIEWNNLPRLINFDTSIEGVHFIQTNKFDDMINKKHRITAFQQDVREDRSSWLKFNSESVKKRQEHPQEFAVRLGFYLPIGVGSWSQDLSFVWILPEKPQNLPPFIKQNILLYNLFSSFIQELEVNSTVVTNLEETVSRMSEHISKAAPDESRQRVQSELLQIAGFLQSAQQRPQHPEEKKKPDDR